MATIKTTGTGTGLRILTKTAAGIQRVSCSCCDEAGCCPYPADQLGIGYTQDDLPDTIDVDGLILGVPTRIIVPRSGSFYGPINQSIFNGGAFSEFIFVATGVAGTRWFRNYTNGEPIGLGEPCLFQTLEGSIQDTFADTYTVNTYDDFVGGSPVSTFTITRESLCVWSGFDARYGVTGTIVTLDYNTPNENTTRATLWTMQGFGRVDGGPYNSPVGIYLDGNYVWEVVE
jgi:hypothetical protein